MDSTHSLDSAICAYLVKKGYTDSTRAFLSESKANAGSEIDLELIWRSQHGEKKEHVEETHGRARVEVERARGEAVNQLTASAAAAIEAALSKDRPHSWTKDASVSMQDRLTMAQRRKATAAASKQFPIHPSNVPPSSLPLNTNAPTSYIISSMALSNLKNTGPISTDRPLLSPMAPNPLEGIKASSITNDELALFQKLRQQATNRGNSTLLGKRPFPANDPTPSHPLTSEVISALTTSHDEGASGAAGGKNVNLSASQAISLLMQRQPSLGRAPSQGSGGVINSPMAPQGQGSAILNNYLTQDVKHTHQVPRQHPQQQHHQQQHPQQLMNLPRVGGGGGGGGGGGDGGVSKNGGTERRQPSTGSSLPPPVSNVPNIPIGTFEPMVTDKDVEQKRMLMLLEQRQSLLRIQQLQRASQKDTLGQMMVDGGMNANSGFGALALAPFLDNSSWKQPQGPPVPPLGAASHPMNRIQSIEESPNVPSLTTSDPELLSNASLTSPKGRGRKAAARPQSAGGRSGKKSGGGRGGGVEKKGKGSKRKVVSNAIVSPNTLGTIRFMEGLGAMRGGHGAMSGDRMNRGPSPLDLHTQVDPSSLTDLGNLLKNQEYLSWLAQRQAMATHPPAHYKPTLAPHPTDKQPSMTQPSMTHPPTHPPVTMTGLARAPPPPVNVNTDVGLLGHEPALSPLLNTRRRSSFTGHGLLDDIGLGLGLEELEEVMRRESPLLDLAEITDKRFSVNGEGLLLDM